MKNSVKIGNLSSEIKKYLTDYYEDISEEVEETSKEMAKEAKKELKKISPSLDKSKKRNYAKGWSIKEGKKGKDRYSIKIWNRTNYRLVHILEFGHTSRNGKHVKGKPHVRPTEKKYKEKFIKELEKKIRRSR